MLTLVFTSTRPTVQWYLQICLPRILIITMFATEKVKHEFAKKTYKVVFMKYENES